MIMALSRSGRTSFYFLASSLSFLTTTVGSFLLFKYDFWNPAMGLLLVGAGGTVSLAVKTLSACREQFRDLKRQLQSNTSQLDNLVRESEGQSETMRLLAYQIQVLGEQASQLEEKLDELPIVAKQAPGSSLSTTLTLFSRTGKSGVRSPDPLGTPTTFALS